MSEPISEGQLRYIRWLTRHVGSPIPFPALLSATEAEWLIQAQKEMLWKHRQGLAEMKNQ